MKEYRDDLNYESKESEGGEDVICPDLRSPHIQATK
jgi:hypothetical protein